MSQEIKAGAIVLLTLGMFAAGLIWISEGFTAAVAGLTRTHSGGEVTVKVTYLNPQASDAPRFQVVLETHSVDLDSYDLKKLSSLRDGTGKSFEPGQVENKGSGHHRQVVLSFPRFSSQPKAVEVVIRNIGGVKERSFRWEF